MWVFRDFLNKKIAMMNENCIVEICPSLVSFVTVETCMWIVEKK